MSSDRYKRFVDSMQMDFDKWHDGTGYDVELLLQLSDEEKLQVEDLILSRGIESWRDLEALAHVGSIRALHAIEEARLSDCPKISLAATKYGRETKESDLEEIIIRSLQRSGPFNGLSQAIDAALTCPTKDVRATLLNIVETESGSKAYSCASALLTLCQVIRSYYDDSQREFLLKFSEPDSEVRRQAIQDLKVLIESK